MSTDVSYLFDLPPSRPTLTRRLPRAVLSDESFERWGKEYEVDPVLLRRIHGSEDPSKGRNPNITSWAGAGGPMQLMPGTAARFGVDSNNPDENVKGAAAYLRFLLDTFNGDVPSAVAAYNAGEGAVQKHGLNKVRKFSNFPKGDPRRGGYQGSTGAYVDKITGDYTGAGYHPDRAAVVADLFDNVQENVAVPSLPGDVAHLFDKPDAPKQGLFSTSSRIGVDEETGESSAEDVTDSLGNPLSVRPLDYPSQEDNRSLTERAASGAKAFADDRENSDFIGLGDRSPLTISRPFSVSIKGDARKLPSPDEVSQSVIQSMGAEAVEADRKFRAETGRSIAHLEGYDYSHAQFDPQTGTYNVEVVGANYLPRLMSAYLQGGLVRAQEEGGRIQQEMQRDADAIAKHEATPRVWQDTARAALADTGLAATQLAHNVTMGARALGTGYTEGFDSSAYKELEAEDKRSQRAINDAQATTPQETDTVSRMARGGLAMATQAPMYMMGGAYGAPIIAALSNANRGLIAAGTEGAKMVPMGAAERLVGGMTAGSSPLVRQVATRTAAGTTNALASGETDPKKLAEAFTLGAVMPVGKAGGDGGTTPRPGGMFEKGSAPVGCVPEKSATINAQMRAMQAGKRRAVLITPGSPEPKIPAGYLRTETSEGVFIHPETYPRRAVHRQVERGTHGKLLGIVGERGSETVVARGKDGTEYQAVNATPENVVAQARAFRKQYPDAEIEVGGKALEDSIIIDRTNGNSQFDDLLEGRTNYAIYPRGEKLPVIPDGYTKTLTSKGMVIHPKLFTPESVKSNARRGTLAVLDMTDADGRLLAIKEPEPKRGVMATVFDIGGAFKSIKSSGDVSALLRQGLPFALSEPRSWYRGMKQGIRALDDFQYERIVEGVDSHPLRGMAEDSGLFLATLRGGEEAFPSKLVNRVPGIKQAEHSFNATLDVMRLEAFSKYAEVLEADGITPASNPKAYKDLARRINSMSGRGDLGRLNKYTEALNVPFFSPRLIKSRLDMLNPVEYMRLDPAVRKIALKQTAKITAALVGTMLTAKLAGAEVSTDIESSEFGKIKVGNTRYDVSGGMSRYLRVALQLASRLKDGDMGEAASLLLREGRKNLSPAVSYGVNAAVGEDVQGEEFGWQKDSIELVTPLMIQDLMQAFDEEGLTGSLKSLPSVVGIGTQTYGSETGSRYVEENLKGHRQPREKPVNTKANEKIANDPELKAIVTELHRLDDVVGAAWRRKTESEDDYLERLEAEEPLIKESLSELIASPEYGRLTDVEKRKAIRYRVREIRNVER